MTRGPSGLGTGTFWMAVYMMSEKKEKMPDALSLPFISGTGGEWTLYTKFQKKGLCGPLFSTLSASPEGVDLSFFFIFLGCGTGLCGPLFRNLSASLEGVDLSENMVALARNRQVYNHLAVGELVEAIQHWGRQDAGARAGAGAGGNAGVGGDVVLAADVLVYFGNLEPFLSAAADAVRRRGGLVAFTTERLEPAATECQRGGGGWKLTTSGRYAHCADYVVSTALGTGKLRLSSAQDITPRWNRGKPVAGTLFLFRASEL